ncbi:MAG TPA: hypothetical protein VH253_11220 [Phycisphaerae bacterium]|nr:hypothetical protein [Phycisphaerae bacterium]
MVAALLAAASAGGCQALAILGGGGSVPAQYTLPKGKRILVFVDPRPTVRAPADFPSALGDAIGQHLYKYGLADHLVTQDRLTALRRDNARFPHMGIADVARATDADVVIYVDLITYDVSAISDNSIAQGNAHVLVKVLDANGNRLYPKNSSTGTEISAEIEPAFTSERDMAAVVTDLTKLLGLRVGRLFQSYDNDDAVLAK